MYANHRSLVPAGGASGPSSSGPPPPPNAGPGASSGAVSGSNGGPAMGQVPPPNAGPSGGPPGGPSAGNGPAPIGATPSSASAARLADLLDFVRQEFDLVGNDATTLKVQRDEFEHRSE